MLPDHVLEKFPLTTKLRDGVNVTVRLLGKRDEVKLHKFLLAVPEEERLFIKQPIFERAVVRDWCRHADYERNLPLLVFHGQKIIGEATLHQRLGGWKRHIGRVSVLVHPKYRGRGLATTLIGEILDIARGAGLERVEATFIAEQEAAMKMFAMFGFNELVRLEDYVKDMTAITHDYVLMGLDLRTDEEYASAAG